MPTDLPLPTIVVELLSGILRFFPNTIIATLFILGITLGKLSWILIAVGGLIVTILTLTIQYVFLKANLATGMSGVSIMEACSLLPTAGDGPYMDTPSLWISLSSFIATFIFVNARNVYVQNPVRVSKDRISVQQRKGTGIISMLAVCVLFVCLLVPRWWTTCESVAGTIFGLLIGISSGFLWWHLLNACGADVFPDIHGVMIGLRPGMLKTNPVACTKQ